MWIGDFQFQDHHSSILLLLHCFKESEQEHESAIVSQEKVRMIPNPSIKLSLHSESQPLIFKYLQHWKQRDKGSRI